MAGTAPIWPDGSCDPDPGAQARRCLEIIEQALGELGAGLEHVVRTRMFISDRAHQDAVGEAHGAVFGDHRPVATMVVCDLLDPRWAVEIEAEAVAPWVARGGPGLTARLGRGQHERGAYPGPRRGNRVVGRFVRVSGHECGPERRSLLVGRARARRRAYRSLTALSTSCTEAFASPNSISVFSL